MTIDVEIVKLAAVGTVGASVLLVTTYLMTALVASRIRSRRSTLIGEGIGLVLSTIQDGELTPGRLERVCSFPSSVQLTVLHRVSTVIRASEDSKLRQLVESIGIHQAMHNAAHSRWWWRRLQAVRYFSIIGGDNELVEKLLEDDDDWVRAEAISWSRQELDPDVIERLLTILESDDRFCRLLIQDALYDSGPLVEAPLRARMAKQNNPEILVAMLQISGQVRDSRLTRSAIKLVEHDSPLVRAAAISAIDSMPGKAVSETLTELLSDEHAIVRQAACKALGRLKHWPAAPALKELLSDRTWDVAWSAARALSEVGSPGVILLRRAVSDRSVGWHEAQRALDEAAILSAAEAA